MEDKRLHRTPFSSAGTRLLDANGQRIALCATSGLAHYLAVTGSNFDKLTELVRICRAEYELLDNPQDYPAYLSMIEYLEKLENDLRGDK